MAGRHVVRSLTQRRTRRRVLYLRAGGSSALQPAAAALLSCQASSRYKSVTGEVRMGQALGGSMARWACGVRASSIGCLITEEISLY